MYRPSSLSPCSCGSETCELCGIAGGSIEITRRDAENGMAAASLRERILGSEGGKIAWWKKYPRRNLVKQLGKATSLAAHTWARVTSLVALPGPRGVLDRIRYEVFVEMTIPWISEVTNDARMCIGLYARLLAKRKTVSGRKEFDAFAKPFRAEMMDLISHVETIAHAADKFLVSCVHENLCLCCGMSYWTLFSAAKPPLCSRKCQQTTGRLVSVFELVYQDDDDDDDDEDDIDTFG